jgi:DinB superfamily
VTVRRLDWPHEVVDQLDWHWRQHLRPRLDGLTDEEYRWEPAPGAWSIRPREQARTAGAAGAAGVVIDGQWPPPEPHPVTTIAWRLGHLAIGVFGARAANHFGDGGVTNAATDWPLTATGGLALLDHHYGVWTAGVRALDADGMERPCGAAEGPYATHPFGALVLHINREAIHHGAEIALLRDLYLRRPQLG